MAEDVGLVLKKVQETLGHHEASLGSDPFRELGDDPDYGRTFLADLNDSRQRLLYVERLVGRDFDVQRLNAYAETQGELRHLYDYVSKVVTQASGSVANTQHARRRLAAAQDALGRLMGLMGVGEVQDEGAPPPPQHPPNVAKKPAPLSPTATSKSMTPPPPRPPDAAEIATPPAATGKSAPQPQQCPPDAADEATPPAPDMTSQKLAELLTKGYDKEEMLNLAHRLGFVVDDLPTTGTLFTMARSLVGYAERRGRVQALVEKVRQERPHLFA